MRDIILKVENNEITLSDALQSIDNKPEFIDLFLIRNPTKKPPEFIPYIHLVSLNSLVLLFPLVASTLHFPLGDSVFMHRLDSLLINQYCINSINEYSQQIIKRISDPDGLMKKLAPVYKEAYLVSEEYDKFISDNVYTTLKRIEKGEGFIYDDIIDGITKRLGDPRRDVYKRGIRLSQIISGDETTIIKTDNSTNIKSNNDDLIEVHNVYPLRDTWKPRYFREALDNLRKGKEIKACLKELPSILKRTQKEKIPSKLGVDLLELILNNSDENPIEILNELFLWEDLMILEHAINKLYSDGVSLHSKIMICHVLCKNSNTFSVLYLKKAMRLLVWKNDKLKDNLLKNNLRHFLECGLLRVEFDGYLKEIVGRFIKQIE